MAKIFDTTPLAKILEGMAAEKWNPAGAISELIDNALGEARGAASEVICIYDKRDRKLTVRDNGRGLERLGHLFQLGCTVGISPADIGVRGMGGTKALLWLASEVRIYTMRNGKMMSDHIRWKDHEKDFPQVCDDWTEPNNLTPEWLKKLGHGTHIDLWLRPGRNVKEDQIQNELQRTYSCGLRHGKKIEWITITAQGRDYSKIFMPERLLSKTDPNFIELSLDVPSDAGPLHAVGVVAWIDELPYKDSVISIGFGHRTIMTTRRCYTNADGRLSYSGSGVVGYVDLIGGGWKTKLTTTKDDFDDARVFDALMHLIFQRIEPLLKLTEQERLQLVLSDLALDLTAAFNGINEPNFDLLPDGINESGAASVNKLNEDGLGRCSDNVRPFKPIKPRAVDPSCTGGNPGGNEKPPAARLKLQPVPDREIDGALCRLLVRNSREATIEVEINKEHEVMDELLKPKAVNKMALAMMVTREVASAFIRKPAATEHMLSKRLQERLQEVDDEVSRERLLARLLMDSVKRPQLDQEAVAS